MRERLSVQPACTRRDRKRFQRLPWSLYANDQNWVPPLLSSERELLGWGGHPFYENADILTLLAERRGEVIGRLAVLVNHVHNRKYDERRGFFGFFECVNEVGVARALFDAGEVWLRERGMTSMRGPANPSLNHTCGLLIGGHGSPPRVMMAYNPPYYAALLEACGFGRSHDLYAYEGDTAGMIAVSRRYARALQSVQRRSDLLLRPFDPRRFQQEVETYVDIYNRSLDGTWGFAPLQPREAAHVAKELRHVLVPELAMFAEVAGKPAGAVLALLDYNQILRKLNGRLFPFGFIRLLAGQRKIDAIRTLAITMAPEYQHSGIATLLLHALVEPARKRGIRHWEFSWVLESNMKSRRPLEKCGARIARTYRMYDKEL
jgi:GNAT superfamily N-acetyltransferase